MNRNRPIKIEDALQACLFDFCESENPRFKKLFKVEGKDLLYFMIPYWEKKEDYEKCSIILSKIRSCHEVD